MLNAIAFLLMFIDKRHARYGAFRIAEKYLLGLAVLGGSAGIWLGMKVFRHKTKHSVFAYGIPLVICLQVALLLMSAITGGRSIL
jgi:uncharacterized membrane protein YsdA (DUF1294 family)